MFTIWIVDDQMFKTLLVVGVRLMCVQNMG